MGTLVPHVQRPVTQRLRFGPFRGMRTAAEERASDPSLVDLALNMLPTDPERGGAYVVVPPVVQTSGLPVGSRTGYISFPDPGATTASHFTLTIAEGALWWLTATSPTGWGQVVSASVLAGAGVGLATSDSFTYLVINQKLLVSDGVNTPWTWDGTPEGGITLLTNCPPLYGQPTEYAAKLFGIKASDRRTVVWSEENDLTTGYQAAGFNNAWTIGQQSDDKLTGIYGRNDGLYYWRPHSTGRIIGAVAGEFRTTHTQDAVSSVTGLVDRSSLVDAGDALWWYSTEERIVRYSPGSGIIADVSPVVFAVGAEQILPTVGPNWGPSRKPGATVDVASHASGALIGPNETTARTQVWFSVPAPVFGFPALGDRVDHEIILVYDAETARPLGYLWQPNRTGPGRHLAASMVTPNFLGATPRRIAISDDLFNNPVLWAAYQSPPFVNTTVGTLVGPVAGGDDTAEWAWIRCDVATRLPAKPATESGATLVLKPLGPTVANPGTLTATPNPDAVNLTTGKTTYGLDTLGRWLRPLFTCIWNGTGQGYGIQGYTLHATAASEDPGAA